MKCYEESNILQILTYMQSVSSRRRVLKGVGHVKCNMAEAHISSKMQFKDTKRRIFQLNATFIVIDQGQELEV